MGPGVYNLFSWDFVNQVRGINTDYGLVGCEKVYIRGKNLIDGFSFAEINI